MCNWFTLLYTWNWRDIANQPHSNKTTKKQPACTLGFCLFVCLVYLVVPGLSCGTWGYFSCSMQDGGTSSLIRDQTLGIVSVWSLSHWEVPAWDVLDGLYIKVAIQANFAFRTLVSLKLLQPEVFSLYRAWSLLSFVVGLTSHAQGACIFLHKCISFFSLLWLVTKT